MNPSPNYSSPNQYIQLLINSKYTQLVGLLTPNTPNYSPSTQNAPLLLLRLDFKFILFEVNNPNSWVYFLK